MIDTGDEGRCNLEDEDSFEEQKRDGLLYYKTPGLPPRKSSINLTPKSRVIEPGKIFGSRQMTPSMVAGMRSRGVGGGLWGQRSIGTTTNINHKHSRSNLITGS